MLFKRRRFFHPQRFLTRSGQIPSSPCNCVSISTEDYRDRESNVGRQSKNGLRERTIEDLKHRLSWFEEDFGDQRLSEIKLEDIEDWLDAEE